MTSQLKIRCLLKTTAKEFWTKQRGEKKNRVLREREGKEGGGLTGSLGL